MIGQYVLKYVPGTGAIVSGSILPSWNVGSNSQLGSVQVLYKHVFPNSGPPTPPLPSLMEVIPIFSSHFF